MASAAETKLRFRTCRVARTDGFDCIGNPPDVATSADSAAYGKKCTRAITPFKRRATVLIGRGLKTANLVRGNRWQRLSGVPARININVTKRRTTGAKCD